MRGVNRVVRVANPALRPLNLRLEFVRPDSWDRQFEAWIKTAESRGLDPNDLGDMEWGRGGGDLLTTGLEEFYLPLATREKTVLELGPGSGRLSRHLIGNCGRMILVDSSKMVCEWIQRYLSGRGNFEVHKINGNYLPVPDASVDAIVAHGVFEHLDELDIFEFLVEFARVLTRDGRVAFNFNDLSSAEAPEIMRAQYGSRRPERFRLHHPESIRCVATAAGLRTLHLEATNSRIGFALLAKHA